MFDLTLIAIIIFGIINSFTDLKFGKIKNLSILSMILVSIVLNLYLNSFTLESMINSVISLSLGFFLFYTNYWSAGDAKLFFAFVLLLPVTAYHFGKVSYFPAIAILINAFVPLTIFYLITSLLQIKKKPLTNLLKGQFKLKDLLITVLYLFGFNFIFHIFNIQLDVISSSFILLLFFQLLKKIPKNYQIILFLSLSVLNLIFQTSILSADYVYNFIISLILYQIFSIGLGFLYLLSFSNFIPIANLKAGQFLAEPLFRFKNSFSKTKGEKIYRLSQDDISLLKKLHSSRKLAFNSIKISYSLPFAPFIFVGVLITYLVGGNLFSFIYLKYLIYLLKPIFS